MKSYFFLILLTIVIFGSVVSAETFGYGRTESVPINYSLIPTVNNSQFLQGLTPQQVADLFDASGYLPLAGGTMAGNIDMNSNQLTDMHSLILSGTGYLGDWDGVLNTANHFAPIGDLTYALGLSGLRWLNLSVGDVYADGVDSYFNRTLLIDGDIGTENADATLAITSGNNLHSCINLTEGDAHLGFQICNDGSGTNRLVFSNAHDGYEWFWIDRDDGTINFLNDTVFTNLVVENVNSTGNITAPWFNGNWNGSLWTRTGTTISPKTAGDDILTIGTLGAGATTVTSLDAGAGAITTTSTGRFDGGLIHSNGNVVINIENGEIYSTNDDFFIDLDTGDIISVVNGQYSIKSATRQLIADDGTDIILDWSTAETASFGDSNIITTGTNRADGGFGVGTAPSYPFHWVSSTAALQYGLRFTDSNNKDIQIGMGSTGRMQFGADTTNWDFNDIAGNTYFSIDASTSSPYGITFRSRRSYSSPLYLASPAAAANKRIVFVGQGSANAGDYMGVWTDTPTAPFSVANNLTVDASGNLATIGAVTIDSDTNGLILGDGQDTSISYDGTNMIFNTSEVGSGIAYFSGNVSATDFIDRTSIYDKSQGSSLSFAKDSSEFAIGGEIDHSKFYGYTIFNVTDFSKPIIETIEKEVCEEPTEEELSEPECHIETYEETTYPFKMLEEGVSMSKELSLLRQQIFELKIQNENFQNTINKLCALAPKNTC